ncbi:MAG: GDP-mannose 4,6-dehydratase, partial [Candidatus Caldarchaeum sp.]
MTVLVTGATGFIGAWVARNLHKKGVKFILSDIRFDTSRLKYLIDNPESLPFISLDLRNAADLD